eukprot:3447170-Amphidinium_carterae.1
MTIERLDKADGHGPKVSHAVYNLASLIEDAEVTWLKYTTAWGKPPEFPTAPSKELLESALQHLIAEYSKVSVTDLPTGLPEDTTEDELDEDDPAPDDEQESDVDVSEPLHKKQKMVHEEQDIDMNDKDA